MSASYSHEVNRPSPGGAPLPAVPGLRHVDDQVLAGLVRRRTGRTIRIGKKRFVPEFKIEDDAGSAVTDDTTLDRIRKLAIPPAWENVWICPHPSGHIQATGRDARGRKQYRYHPRWREERDRTKYSRMVAFGEALPALRRRVEGDLSLEGLPKQKVLATLVRLLETTFIRVGNEEYARTNKSFGLTTMKDRHVHFSPGEVLFRFRGKSGISHEVAVHDPRVARIVKRCRDLPGQELFQYVAEDGGTQTIDSADVNDYIREATGGDFTAKDFRTWAGTVLATMAFHEIAAATPPVAKPTIKKAARGAPSSGAARRTAPGVAAPRTAARVRAAASVGGRRRTQKDVVRAITQVASRLGNTPSVCRKCYVHPVVIAAYLEGTLVGPAPASVSRKPRRAGRKPSQQLRPEEAAVLALLRRPSKGLGGRPSGAAGT